MAWFTGRHPLLLPYTTAMNRATAQGDVNTPGLFRATNSPCQRLGKERAFLHPYYIVEMEAQEDKANFAMYVSGTEE